MLPKTRASFRICIEGDGILEDVRELRKLMLFEFSIAALVLLLLGCILLLCRRSSLVGISSYSPKKVIVRPESTVKVLRCGEHMSLLQRSYACESITIGYSD